MVVEARTPISYWGGFEGPQFLPTDWLIFKISSLEVHSFHFRLCKCKSALLLGVTALGHTVTSAFREQGQKLPWELVLRVGERGGGKTRV